MPQTDEMYIDRRVNEYVRREYWSGAHCMELRVPWFTPDAIRFFGYKRVFSFLKTARVLELGAGGSTLFFSDFCESVFSIETNVEWAGKVIQTVPKNAAVVCCQSWADVQNTIRNIPGQFDIALIDGDPAMYPRGEAADLVLASVKPKAIFITDNYYLEGSMVKAFQVPSDWSHEEFNDKHWHGCGTRISTRGF